MGKVKDDVSASKTVEALQGESRGGPLSGASACSSLNLLQTGLYKPMQGGMPGSTRRSGWA